MKLVGFKRMNKQKKIIASSIVGILLILGSILLYRSYALYEEEEEYNVLRGKIPDFGYDIKMLSVVVDGEKSKTIPTRGLYKTQIDCSNGTTGEWDYNAWNLTLENVSENARCNITFTSNLSNEEYNKYLEAGVSLRRNTYRGKDISSYLTVEGEMNLFNQISSGRFNDIYVGDYLISNNIKWLVADLDNYLYTGDASLTKHHATIIPARALTTAAMNDTNTTEGGYYNSKMKQETLPSVLTTYIEPAFSGHILTYKNILTTSINKEASSMAGANWKGSSNDWSWYESQIDLMSETNVFGADKFSSSAYDTGIDNKQYALFQLRPQFINNDGTSSYRVDYWLKNVSSSTFFVNVLTSGNSAYAYASGAGIGVRPRFLIG